MNIGVILLVIAIVLPMTFILGAMKSSSLGSVKCRRCHHVGKTKSGFRFGQGAVPVCSNCGSEDWVRENTYPASEKPTARDIEVPKGVMIFVIVAALLLAIGICAYYYSTL